MSYGIKEIDELFEMSELKMDDILERLEHKFLSIRAGRANPHILDGIKADYYGVPTSLNQMANIAVSEARILTITVWDHNSIKPIEKAIQASNIGINPNNDGKVIRLIFPELTEERRLSLAKEIKVYSDNAHVGLRNIRREMNDSIKKLKKDNIITEDDVKDMNKNVDDLLADYTKKVTELHKSKEEELMSV